MGLLQSYSDKQKLARLQHSVFNVLSENVPVGFHIPCPALGNVSIYPFFSVGVLEKLFSTSSDFSSTNAAGTMSLLRSDLHSHVLEVEANSFWRFLFSLVVVMLL